MAGLGVIVGDSLYYIANSHEIIERCDSGIIVTSSGVRSAAGGTKMVGGRRDNVVGEGGVLARSTESLAAAEAEDESVVGGIVVLDCSINVSY